MKINLSNFETSDVSLFDVSIVQRDVGGGKTEKEDIDCLEEYPTAKSLIIWPSESHLRALEQRGAACRMAGSVGGCDQPSFGEVRA